MDGIPSGCHCDYDDSKWQLKGRCDEIRASAGDVLAESPELARETLDAIRAEGSLDAVVSGKSSCCGDEDEEMGDVVPDWGADANELDVVMPEAEKQDDSAFVEV